MGKTPIPEPIEWHDNISTIEESEIIDPSEILMGHKRSGKLKTSKGSFVVKKIPKRRQMEIATKHKDMLSQQARDYAKVDGILSKSFDVRTPEERLFVADFAIRGFPYTLDICHASIVAPEMDKDTFELVLEEFDESERTAIINLIMGMYNPKEDVKKAATEMMRLAAEYGVPIDKDLDLNNMTFDQFDCMQRGIIDKITEMRNAGGR